MDVVCFGKVGCSLVRQVRFGVIDFVWVRFVLAGNARWVGVL